MEFTGERVIPGEVDIDLWNEHLARYAFAASVAGRLLIRKRPLRLLDAGCGSGYGTAQLACLSPDVNAIGMDNSEEALAWARRHYTAANLSFARGDCLALDFPPGQFDLVVAFEMIEHLADGGAFLEQASRVLGPGGLLIISTPNRRYYTEERDYTNPFHQREYDAAEFDELLKRYFPERQMFAQNHAPAVCFSPAACAAGSGANGSGVAGRAHFAETGKRDDQPHFLIAVCARQSPPFAEPFVFVPSSANLLREREQHIAKLDDEVRRNLEELARRDEAIRSLQAEYAQEMERARGVIRERERELKERTDWAASLEQERQRLAGIITGLQADLENKVAWARDLEADIARAREALAKLQAEFDERTAWALKLDAEVAAARADLNLIFGSRWYRLGKKTRLTPVPPSDPRGKAKP